MMAYVGIDPGNKGALVAIDSSMTVIAAEVMPTIDVGTRKKKRIVLDPVAVLAWLDALIFEGHDLHAVLEKAQSMPGQGIASTFRYGKSAGMLEMALLARGIPHDVVHPRTWQRVVLRDVPGQGKRRAIIACQRRLPLLDLTPGRKRKPHDGLADAGCMAMYSARQVAP